ncbi:MAG: hypothetical protein AB2693_23795 [Candidatus Thiodiazotropha sp.]
MGEVFPNICLSRGVEDTHLSLLQQEQFQSLLRFIRQGALCTLI